MALVVEGDGAVAHRGDIHAERKGGLRRASVRDFHSFRVTWVTLALTAGVPLELVQKVTGHKTTDIVLKHYFQPGREDFRRALQSAMPQLLTNGQKSPKDEMREIVEKLTAKNWKGSKARLLTLDGKAESFASMSGTKPVSVRAPGRCAWWEPDRGGVSLRGRGRVRDFSIGAEGCGADAVGFGKVRS